MAERVYKAHETSSPVYQPLLVVAVAVCGGIVLDRYTPASFGLLWAMAAGSWMLWLGTWRTGGQRLGGVLILISLAAAGAAWHNARWSLFAAEDLGAFTTEAQQPVCLEAIARRGPRRVPAPEFDPLRAIATPDRTRLALDVISVRDADRWRPACGIVQLSVAGHLLDVQAGDRLRVFAHVAATSAPSNPGEFDFREHLRADRQLCRLVTDHPECVTRVAPGAAWRPRRLLDRARLVGDAWLWSSVGRGQSGLAQALVLGEREQLDAQATRHFYETGTVHLLSISGLHVGLLAYVLFRGLELGLMRRGPALLLVAAITTAYALVIDAEPPAVRATVMVWLVCLALYSGRPLSPFNLLAAAALVVVAMNPAELFRIGPQLSFLAVATLAWCGPRLQRRQPGDPLARLIAATRPWPGRLLSRLARSQWQFFQLTTAVWLVSLPLVLARFNLVSPATLLLTPLLAVPVSMGLFAGFLLASFGWLIWPLSVPIGWLCDFCLACVSGAVALFDRLPGSHFWLPGPAWWWLIGFYGALATCAVLPRLRPPRRWCLGIAAGWLAIGFLVARHEQRPRGELECTFLSVGHGCATVIEMPDGRLLLYDAGQLGSPAAAARSISSFLWSRGRTHIDAAVISHADVDHYNALPELLRRFTVGVVYVSPVMFDHAAQGTETLRRAIHAAGVPLVEIRAGDRLGSSPDCAIEVLHPPARGTLGSDNSNSIVLAVEHLGRRLLLPGDLESPGMDELLAETPLDCDVVLAPHHGSVQSDPPGFASWTTPEWVVISGDRRSNRPEVSDAYRARGATVLNTSQNGAVSVTIGQKAMRVSVWRQNGAPLPVLAAEDEDEQQLREGNAAQ